MIDSRLADHTTPFIQNEWYVAALSEEVDHTLRDRKILGVGVLLFRTLGGTAVALRNRCPHRSFPLSKGQLIGDTVVCGYHGIQFGADGKCVEVPSQQTVPTGLRTRSFPLVERPPFLWIWMGDPGLANPDTIPDHHWLADAAYASFSGYLHCGSNYIRLHENVLDLTHFPYVHGEAVGGLDYVQAPFKVEALGTQVVIRRRMEQRPVNLAYAASIGNAGHLCNRMSESWFVSPAIHIAHAKIEDLEGGIDGRTDFHFKFAHCFTPESQHSTHYFFGSARDSGITDAVLTRKMETMARETFLQDDEALTLVEQTWMDEDPAGYRELSVRGDLAGLHMRRAIAKLAEQNSDKSHTSSSSGASSSHLQR